MHGRVKKDLVELPADEKERQREQVRTARSLFAKLLDLRRNRVYSQQTLDMTSKALQFHPEFPTLWGYRREILLSGQAGESLRDLIEVELKLLEKALRKSQKVYSIWFHRRWAVERAFEACGTAADAARRILDTELALCGKLLEVDERNFHCWNHRAHVLGLMRRLPATASPALAAAAVPAPAEEPAAAPGPVESQAGDASAPVEAAATAVPDAAASDAAVPGAAAPAPALPDFAALDLQLSKQLINRNFSNYSAWHLRALLQQPPPPGKGTATALADEHIKMAEELEWVQQGIYTEPNDQSVWLYHHWLTTLGRGDAQLRITHCATLGGELYVFFSGPVCIASSEKEAPEDAPGCLRVLRDGSSEATVLGDLLPAGPDISAGPHRLTRQLPASRRRWSQAWRFVPRAEEPGALQPGAELVIEVTTEALGSHADGTPSHGQRRLGFRGRAVDCDRDAGQKEEASSALAALLGAAPDADRAAVLRGELARVDELLEIEPDCRWALLARGRLAAAAAAGSSAAEAEAVERAVGEGYQQISALDPLRRGFYAEAQAASLLRVRAMHFLASGSPRGELDASNLGLRHLAPSTLLATFGVRVLNIEGNDLQALGPVLQLLSLEELRAGRNRLAGDVTEAFVLPRLRRLDVSNNLLCVKGVQTPVPEHLEEVNISGNAAVLAVLASAAKEGEDASKAAEALLGRLFDGGRANWSADWDSAGGRCVCRRAA